MSNYCRLEKNMNLKKFRVTHFRSVIDSGWIECDKVTTLIGINESGKSNILLALWKLNPARGGKIDRLHDLPVTELSNYDKQPEKVSFIEAVFILNDSAINFQEKLGVQFSQNDEIHIQRWYNGEYAWRFPDENVQTSVSSLEKDYIDENGHAAEPKFTHDEVAEVIIGEIPAFVYYSNYGNLASRIYLPHAIKWLKNETVEGITPNESQIRTIRVLFDYVGLEPEEIFEYGKDAIDIARATRRNDNPTKEEIQNAKTAKEKRALLLQSAGNKLTTEFRDWWKQGEYKFRFQADGDYFQIWVSDTRRPEEVDLELRSTGLQWFLSFYLVFIVESQNENQGAILLLDEAGLTLHPLAQKDLAVFFNKLSETNQIINTTHSPFIIDTENIDRCRVVYYDDRGHTVVSENLREGMGDIGEKSIYAVHAALGLTVSDVLFQGSQIVIVEGISDQYYLTAIKNVLIRDGKIHPKKDILFAPAGGVRGVSGITGLISSKNDDLPFVILDSDSSGTQFRKKLVDGLYSGNENKILCTKDFVSIENSEIEDLIPYEFIEKPVLNLFGIRDDDDEFDPNNNEAIIPQIENYAKEHQIELPNGWKVLVAKSFKRQIFAKKRKKIPEEYLSKWTSLFENLCL